MRLYGFECRASEGEGKVTKATFEMHAIPQWLVTVMLLEHATCLKRVRSLLRAPILPQEDNIIITKHSKADKNTRKPHLFLNHQKPIHFQEGITFLSTAALIKPTNPSRNS